MQFDHSHFYVLPLIIWSRVFWSSVMWNLRKAQHWSKSIWSSDRCRPHSLTLGYYQYYLNILWKNINVAYIPVGLVSNSSKKSSQMTCASCMSNLSPFLSATKPLSIYLDSVGKRWAVLIGAGCSPETKNINGSQIDSFGCVRLGNLDLDSKIRISDLQSSAKSKNGFQRWDICFWIFIFTVWLGNPKKDLKNCP